MGKLLDYLLGKNDEEDKKDEKKGELKSSEESMMEFLGGSKAFGSKGLPQKKKKGKKK